MRADREAVERETERKMRELAAAKQLKWKVTALGVDGKTIEESALVDVR